MIVFFPVFFSQGLTDFDLIEFLKFNLKLPKYKKLTVYLNHWVFCLILRYLNDCVELANYNRSYVVFSDVYVEKMLYTFLAFVDHYFFTFCIFSLFMLENKFNLVLTLPFRFQRRKLPKVHIFCCG